MKMQVPASGLLPLFDMEGKSLNGAPFTIKSKKTGKEYTFKVKQSVYKGWPYIHLYVEKEYLNFHHLGYFKNGKIFKEGKEVKTPAAQAGAWVLRMIAKRAAEVLDASLELYHLGSCFRCGKTLTDSVSIERGMGPVCAES